MRDLLPLSHEATTTFAEWPDRAVACVVCPKTSSVLPVWIPLYQARLLGAVPPGGRNSTTAELGDSTVALALGSHPYVDVMADLVEAYGDEFIEVILTGFVEGQILCEARTRQGHGFEVRVSDGLMLSTYLEIPLLGARDVIDKASVPASEENLEMFFGDALAPAFEGDPDYLAALSPNLRALVVGRSEENELAGGGMSLEDLLRDVHGGGLDDELRRLGAESGEGPGGNESDEDGGAGDIR